MRFCGGVVDGGSGEAERRVRAGGEGGLLLGVEGTRLAPPSLALTPLTCSLSAALSAIAAPFLRRICRRERRSFRPVETSVNQ